MQKQLKDVEWKKVNLFSNNMVSNEIWNIKVRENMMTIESKNKEGLTAGLNQQKDGFEVYGDYVVVESIVDGENKIGIIKIYEE